MASGVAVSGAAGAAAAAASASSSAAPATPTYMWISGGFALVAMILFITNISLLAKNGASADSYSDLTPQLASIWSVGGVGILFSCIAIWFYYNSSNTGQSTPIMIALVLSSFAIFISYCAMATAVITKRK
jgi:hypothetical protein